MIDNNLPDGQEITKIYVPEQVFDDNGNIFFNLIYNTEKNFR